MFVVKELKSEAVQVAVAPTKKQRFEEACRARKTKMSKVITKAIDDFIEQTGNEKSPESEQELPMSIKEGQEFLLNGAVFKMKGNTITLVRHIVPKVNGITVTDK